jgi:hypothetical protein
MTVPSSEYITVLVLLGPAIAIAAAVVTYWARQPQKRSDQQR